MNNLPLFDIATIAATVGYLALMVIDILKPVLTAALPAEAKGPAMRLATLLITVILAFVGATFSITAGLIAEQNLWAVAFAILPATGAWYQVESRRKISKKNAEVLVPALQFEGILEEVEGGGHGKNSPSS